MIFGHDENCPAISQWLNRPKPCNCGYAETQLKIAEIAQFKESARRLCRHWDELLNNIDCGEAYDARQQIEAYLGES